jgi:putative two-component system response regulator
MPLLGQPRRILVVDDLAQNRDLLAGLVAALGHEAVTAADGVEALAQISRGIDLVLLDMLMPGLDGCAVVRRIRENPLFKELPVIMVTALDWREDRLKAMEAGADDLLSKPVDRSELRLRIEGLLLRKEAREALWSSQLETVQGLVRAVEMRDPTSIGQAQRVSRSCALLGRSLHFSDQDVESLRLASSLHDVGRIGIPDRVLFKRGELSAEEREIAESHTLLGARLLAGSENPLMKAAEVIALTHHERWDGRGYPQGLAGESIPLWGRICAVADAFDALTRERPDRPAMGLDRVIAILRRGRGSHFDPFLCTLLIDQLDENRQDRDPAL